MKISSISKSCINFNAIYKSEDVLRFITSYPYKNKSVNREMVNFLTGLEIESKEFSSSLPKDVNYLFVYLGIISECQDEVLRQHPELLPVYESYDCQLHLNEGKKAQENWFKKQLSGMQSQFEIKPFVLKRENVEKRYKDIESIFEAIF